MSSTWARGPARSDGGDQRPQRHRNRADPVGQGGNVEIDTLAGETLALAVQRQMQAEFVEHNVRQQSRAGPTAGDGVERRRRLGDGGATAAGEFLAHMLDHPPLGGDALQRLGDVLAQLGQFSAAAGTGFGRRLDHNTETGQMIGQRAARRLAAGLGGNGVGNGGGLDGGSGFLQILQRQLQLLDAGAPLGRLAIALALEPGDLQFQPLDLDVEDAPVGFRRQPCRPLGEDHCVGGGKVGGKRDVGGVGHRESESNPVADGNRFFAIQRHSGARFPAASASRSPPADTPTGPG